MTIFTYVLNRIQNSLVSSLLCSIFSLFKMFSPCGWYVCDNITHCVVTEHFIVWLSLRFRKDNKIWYDSVKKINDPKKNRYSTVLHFHTAFLLFDEKSWIQCQNMLYESASCIWMTIAISFLDPLIFLLLFLVNCSIFLHIFFLVICSKRFAFLFKIVFFSLQKVVVCLLQKKRMHQVENCKENH